MNCIIIEDEKNASDRLRKLIETYLDYLNIDAVFTSIEESIAYLSTNVSPSVIFMDIQLRDGIAFKIFDHVEVTSPVIFTTAYNEFALKAYKTTAIDYLLKPIKKDELLIAMSKLSLDNSKILKFNSTGMSNEVTYVVRFGNRYYVTELDDIAYIKETEKLTIITRKDKLQFPLNVGIDEIFQDLPTHKFTRISKHMIVNIDAIHKIEYHNKIPLIVLEPRLEDRVQVQKDYVKAFSDWLHQQYA